MRGLLLSLRKEFIVFLLISSLHAELLLQIHNVKPRKADLEGVYESVLLPKGIDKMPEEPCCGDVKFGFNGIMDEIEECKDERGK
ncbi:hypothetical protein C0J52_17910 [Blattella germanica]|nr:hypothetical protein C0J52_17910 [Blattella germanica]